MKECSFAPVRYSSLTSDMYLKRMGRDQPVQPEDLFRYQQDKQMRNELRKQILQEIQEKELTFKPTLGERSIKIQVTHSNSNTTYNTYIVRVIGIDLLVNL